MRRFFFGLVYVPKHYFELASISKNRISNFRGFSHLQQFFFKCLSQYIIKSTEFECAPNKDSDQTWPIPK